MEEVFNVKIHQKNTKIEDLQTCIGKECHIQNINAFGIILSFEIDKHFTWAVVYINPTQTLKVLINEIAILNE